MRVVTEEQDLRSFIREITLRFERGMERISAEIREDSRKYFEVIYAEQREQRAEQKAHREESREKHDAILAESRAGRQALLHLLDTLRGNGGTAPSA
jgi:hypothetical protein